MYRRLAPLLLCTVAIAQDVHAPVLSDSQLKPYLLKAIAFNASIANNNAAQANLLKAQVAAKEAAEQMNAAQIANKTEQEKLAAICGDYDLDLSQEEPKCGKLKTHESSH